MNTYVYNSITIIGPDDIITLLRDCRMHFRKVMPIPDGLRHMGRLEWCRRYWGTPHERRDYDPLPEFGDNLTFSCITQETPPLQLLEALCKTNATLWCKCIWHEEKSPSKEGIWVGYHENGAWINHACDWTKPNVFSPV